MSPAKAYALPAFHALIGSDNTSFFSGTGKRSSQSQTLLHYATPWLTVFRRYQCYFVFSLYYSTYYSLPRFSPIILFWAPIILFLVTHNKPILNTLDVLCLHRVKTLVVLLELKIFFSFQFSNRNKGVCVNYGYMSLLYVVKVVTMEPPMKAAPEIRTPSLTRTSQKTISLF